MLTKTYNLSPITLPRILLVDMNSFFASVEQQANPFFRGKPLGVVAASAAKTPLASRGVFVHETSCLIAASKEAKAMGIKTGTLIYKAKKICPDIILVRSEPSKYREVNRQMVKIFYDYTDRVEVYSIDEAFLEIPNDKLQISNPLLIGAEIKKRIRQEIGEWLTCSVGIAPNKFMAKLAADLQKPDGLSIIWQDQLKEVYKNKKLTDLWGISYGWQKRLGKIGITSPLQLLDYPVQNLISLFGKPGYYLWERVNGLEKDVIANSNIEYRNPPLFAAGFGGSAVALAKEEKQYLNDEYLNDQNSFEHSDFEHLNLFRASDLEFRISDVPKSFGHSWVLNFRTTDKERLKPVILRLAEKAARRMRKENLQAYGFYFSVNLVDGDHLGKSKKLKSPINTGFEFYEQALLMWQHWEFKAAVTHIAVGFTGLVQESHQLALFSSPLRSLLPHHGRTAKRGDLLLFDQGSAVTAWRSLTHTLDHLNDKYGEFTVRSGLLTKTSDYAPDAIAFGK